MDEHSVLRKGARAALFVWGVDDPDKVEDLEHDMWLWYLESPGTQDKLSKLHEAQAVTTVKKAAMQILSKQQLSANVFNGKALYSSSAVQMALKGKSTNRYLADVIPRAMEALGHQNEGYAEAIRSRYDDGLVPKENSDVQRLKYAVKSLTEHVNLIAIMADVDAEGTGAQGAASLSAIAPEARQEKGASHSDPTGNMAIMLIEHPELREGFFEEHPLSEFLAGKGPSE